MYKSNKSLTAIVPVFNEEKIVVQALKKLNILKKNIKLEIIVINDGSNDLTNELLKKNSKLYTKLFNLSMNQGKGKAVIEGLKHCSSKYVFIQDADLEYDPLDIINLIQKMEETDADMIMGSRFISSDRSVLHFWHMLGNKIITFLFNIINNTTFTDIYCCYCLFKKEKINMSLLKSNGWGQQAEILTFLVSGSKKIYELSVNYNARTYNEGKKIRYSNFFEVVYWLLLSRLRTYINK